MSAFTPAEIAYLESQRIGRLATVSAAGEPHVVPVNFRYNGSKQAVPAGARRGQAPPTTCCTRIRVRRAGRVTT